MVTSTVTFHYSHKSPRPAVRRTSGPSTRPSSATARRTRQHRGHDETTIQRRLSSCHPGCRQKSQLQSANGVDSHRHRGLRVSTRRRVANSRAAGAEKRLSERGRQGPRPSREPICAAGNCFTPVSAVAACLRRGRARAISGCVGPKNQERLWTAARLLASSLFPLRDRLVQIGPINPNASEPGRPDRRQIARCDQITKRPRADSAVGLGCLQIEQPARRDSLGVPSRDLRIGGSDV